MHNTRPNYLKLYVYGPLGKYILCLFYDDKKTVYGKLIIFVPRECNVSVVARN